MIISLPLTCTSQASSAVPASVVTRMTCGTLTTSSTHIRTTVQESMHSSASTLPLLPPRGQVQSTQGLSLQSTFSRQTTAHHATQSEMSNLPTPTTPPGLSELLISSSFGLPRPSLPTFDTNNEKDYRLLKMTFENLIDCHPHLSEKYKYKILMDHLGGNAKKLACAPLPPTQGHKVRETSVLRRAMGYCGRISTRVHTRSKSF